MSDGPTEKELRVSYLKTQIANAKRMQSVNSGIKAMKRELHGLIGRRK